MAKDQTLRIGIWKMVFMLLITWLTPFSGLGNLILMWNNDHYRRRSAIALGVGLGAGVIPHAVLGTQGWSFSHIMEATQLGMDIWMTFDAVAAYKKSRAARTAVTTAGTTRTTTKAKSKKSTRKKASKKATRKKA
ncbi:MAG: hypothetical protein GY800_05175 [Planctomycetes bacterium]|nr:hypothetical protein [Planctomycetota bacterium]